MNQPKKKRKYTKRENTNLPVVQDNTEIIRNLVLNGDISKMDAVARVKYYNGLCQSMGMNPLSQPFQIIKLQGKEVLYATKNATDQLRKIYIVSVDRIEQKTENDICITTVTGHDKTGRSDGATGAVNVKGLYGDALANAIMKSETKAKRRFTLSICGLGMLDESEIETIPNVEIRNVFADNNGKLEITNGQEKQEPVDLTSFVIHACDWIGSAQSAKVLSTRLIKTEEDPRWNNLPDGQKKEVRDMYSLREKELIAAVQS